mmetsp:Transcript_17601/g.42961  ORF Transcript_17601/g.42961 Transcript_17601/m.42961 type:complete len:82 (+) Transcript_17601:44-289(+)
METCKWWRTGAYFMESINGNSLNYKKSVAPFQFLVCSMLRRNLGSRIEQAFHSDVCLVGETESAGVDILRIRWNSLQKEHC